MGYPLNEFRLLLRRVQSRLRSSTAGFGVLAGDIGTHHWGVSPGWIRRRGRCWSDCLIVWSWKRRGWCCWCSRRWKLLRELGWAIVDKRALTWALICIVSVVIPIGVLVAFLAIVCGMAVFPASLAERTAAGGETALRTNGMPMRAAVVETRLNIRSNRR